MARLGHCHLCKSPAGNRRPSRSSNSLPCQSWHCTSPGMIPGGTRVLPEEGLSFVEPTPQAVQPAWLPSVPLWVPCFIDWTACTGPWTMPSPVLDKDFSPASLCGPCLFPSCCPSPGHVLSLRPVACLRQVSLFKVTSAGGLWGLPACNSGRCCLLPGEDNGREELRVYCPEPGSQMWTPRHLLMRNCSPPSNPNLGKLSSQVVAPRAPRPFCPNPALLLAHRPDPHSVLFWCPRNLHLIASRPAGLALPATSPLSSLAMVPAPYVVPFSLETVSLSVGAFICTYAFLWA